MLWRQVRQAYPDQWLIIEALQAHTDRLTHERILDWIDVIETCLNGQAAIRRYQELHQQYPYREFYFVHTRREKLEITEG